MFGKPQGDDNVLQKKCDFGCFVFKQNNFYDIYIPKDYTYIYYMANIILTGGGTAGHCTPNIALIPFLKKDFNNIYYVGSEHGIEKKIVTENGIPYYDIPCAKLTRKFTAKNLSIPFKVLSGVRKAEKLIDKLRPDVIFSKGGYVAVPLVLAAKNKKIPVISHESDLSVGLANRFTAKYCEKVLTSFKDTALTLKNGEYVGSPIRRDVFNADRKKSLEEFGFDGSKPVILVTGGSQGAEAINKVLRESLNVLLKKYDVLHVCGKGRLKPELSKKGYFQTEFLSAMEKAFAVASVCVSRAGSNTVFELLSLKIPTLLIPLPKGNSRGDQVENAKYFQKQGLIHLLEQDSLTPESLILNINAVYSNRANLIKNLEKNPVTDQSPRISKILSDRAKRNNR